MFFFSLGAYSVSAGSSGCPLTLPCIAGSIGVFATVGHYYCFSFDHCDFVFSHCSKSYELLKLSFLNASTYQINYSLPANFTCLYSIAYLTCTRVYWMPYLRIQLRLIKSKASLGKEPGVALLVVLVVLIAT